MRNFLLKAFLALSVAGTTGSVDAGFPSDAVILDILKARIDTFKMSSGIVVGMVDSTGARYVSYGTTHAEGSTPIDEHTVFEIGSISKVFTAVVLSDMVLKGEVGLRDPVDAYLPEGVTLPAMGDRRITLLDLVTHRSGLPRMPNNFRKGTRTGHGEYGLDPMYQFLSTCTLVSDIGEKFLYSNLGFGLLGEALARRDGKDLESVVVERIYDPLGLKDTRFVTNAEQRAREAGRYDWNLEPVAPLKLDAMKGAGSMRSTAADLVRFLQANIGLIGTDLWPTLQLAHVDREDAIGRRVDIGLGWLTLDMHGRELITHNGATFGNMAFSAFDKEARRGVVVLANARGSYDDIGFHLLNPQTKLLRIDEPAEKPVAVDIDIEKLRPIEGEYAISSNQVLIIRIEDGKIYGNQNEGIELEMKAASETELFFDVLPFVAEFVKNSDGKVTEVVWRAYGQEYRGDKLDFYRSPPSRALVDEDLTRYEGRYEISDKLTIDIRVEDGTLNVHAENQLPMRLVRTPEGFYAYEARAELVFKEEDGRVVGVTLHQDGKHEGTRVEGSR